MAVLTPPPVAEVLAACTLPLAARCYLAAASCPCRCLVAASCLVRLPLIAAGLFFWLLAAQL